MRYWTSKPALGTSLAEPTALCDKLGGLPWGLAGQRWPSCATWEADSGANVGLVLDRTELGEGAPSPRAEVRVVTEARVSDWLEGDEDVEEPMRAMFFDDDAFADVPQDVLDAIESGTKLGGVPAWIQGAGEGPRGDGWRYALQIDETSGGANFGSGRAYVFLDTSGPVPAVKWLWQC